MAVKGKSPRPGSIPNMGAAPGWPGYQGTQGGGIEYIMGPAKGAYSGQEPYTLRAPLFGQEQGQGFAQALQMALQGLQQPGNQLNFAPIAQQAREQFQTKTIPSILERLTQSGGQNSSAYMHTLGQAGHDLESSLAAQQAQYGLESNKLLQNLLNIGLTPQFEYRTNAGREGEGSKITNALVQQLSKLIGLAL